MMNLKRATPACKCELGMKNAFFDDFGIGKVQKKYEHVVTYGTFDLFHVGHVNLLRRISDLAAIVSVGLSTDEFNGQKGKLAVIPYCDRKTVLQSCRYVDNVFAETSWSQKTNDILEIGADALIMGADWVGSFDELKDIVSVIYLPRTEFVSTTKIKNHVITVSKDDIHLG